MRLTMRSVFCTTDPGGKSRKRSAASAASWKNEDLMQNAVDDFDLTEDDAHCSVVPK